MIKKALWINCFLTFALIVLGGTVRNFDAGLSCPDWPLCHGKIIPPFDLEIFLEWFHRLMASLVGFLTLGICITALSQKKYRKPLGWPSVMAVFLVIIQAIFGGMTVIGLLAPVWVASHLAMGLLFFIILLWMYLRCAAGRCHPEPAEESGTNPPLMAALIGLTALVYIQAVLGGFVSASGAGLACPDFPTCMGQWIPPFSPQVGLQFFHRVAALFILFSAIGLYVVSRALKPGLFFQKNSTFILLVICLQILLGIGNVLFKLPKPMSITHLFMAVVLVALFFNLTYKVKHAALS